MALPLLLAAAPAVFKGISGLAQMGKGNRMAKSNQRPAYEIPAEYQKNVALAEQMGRTGMPQQQYNNQLNSIQRNQAGALARFGRNGGGAGSLASIVRAGNDATGNLNSQDSMARMNNQRFAFGQRGLLAQQKLNKWQWDKQSRFQENAAAAQALQGAGRQNAMGALDDLSMLGQTAIGGGMMGGAGSFGKMGLPKGYQMQQQSGLLWNPNGGNSMNA